MPGDTDRVVVTSSEPQPAPDFDSLYQEQWWPMLRVAAGLVDDPRIAEEIVQDAFAAVYRRWDKIRDRRAAGGYLRASVVNRSRSVLRRRRLDRKHDRHLIDEAVEPADHASLRAAELQIMREALDRLPSRQREVLVLRYIAQISDAEIASVTGLSLPGVRSAASRGLAALRTIIGAQS
jgi:RNA polymerase sigma-70 factor (sigma-E family)